MTKTTFTAKPQTVQHKDGHTYDCGSATLHLGDCRQTIPKAAQPESVDLIFADPPFNWARNYEEWDDKRPDDEYLQFTYDWLNLCITALKPAGSFWVNIPDDWAAEIVVHLKARGLSMINWCIWHYRFGQNNKTRFINSKVHALYFAKQPAEKRTFNKEQILELSDRRAIYADPRTENKKDGMPAGLRLPMDVWYGQYWGRIQGNNKERRHNHDNQLPETYLERVVRACSNKGDTVMDPFTGSGTTGTVARWLGRNYIGCELSPNTAKSAWERITKIGPARPLTQQNQPQSTAIFANRANRQSTTQPQELEPIT